MSGIKNEMKIAGINPILISAAVVAAFAMLARFGGDLLNLSCIGFEVIFPFFAAIAVGEWGKTRADDNFDVIAAQGKSLFSWVLSRFAVVFATVCLFAVLGMVIVFLLRNEMSLGEMALMYLSPALFLATLGALLNIFFVQEHISTLICGVIWLVTMLARSLLRFPGAEYFYMFIRYAGDQSGVWLVNKLVLVVVSLFLWGVIYLFCKSRRLS